MRIAMLGTSLFLLLCCQAMARPRDEVMINVYRCAGHASTRVWLDCYYGAAQPERAALGLAPAPQAQVRLTQLPPAPGVPQDIAARDAVIGAAARCGGVVAERPWLDCYYAAADPVRALLGLATEPVTPAAPPPVPAAAHGETGFLTDMLGKPDILAVSRMASYKFDRNGNFTVTLENGAVWRQLDGDNHLAHWSREARSYTVVLAKGAFKSINLTVKGSPTVYKVRRIS